MLDRRYYERIEDKTHRLELTNFNERDSRRWSVDRKLQSRYYCRIRSCDDFLDIFNMKCIFATSMLIAFIVLFVLAVQFYFASFGMLPTSDHFEYIIIGAGPAGSILARRLADSGRTVLLLEAGGPTQYDLGGTDYFGGPVTRFDIPLMWSSISAYEDYHWQGFNIPNVLQAKGVGGCGIHNAMLYVRCLESDINRWNLTNEGWKWKDVLKTYKSLENFVPDIYPLNNQQGIPSYHGTGGIHTITTRRFLSNNLDPISAEFISSGVQYGLKYVEDFNNPEENSRIGVGYYHFNIDNGIRDSVARKMLSSIGFTNELSKNSPINPTPYPISSTSKRLTISLNSKVDKVLLRSTGSGTGLRAFGVEYTQDNIKKRAFLQSKSHGISSSSSTTNIPDSLSVIITAGALLTPQILMNSGIGPEDELKKADIPVKVSSPLVGANLQDHPAVGMTFKAYPSLAAKYPSAYSLVSRWYEYLRAINTVRKSTDSSSQSFTSSSSSSSTTLKASGLFSQKSSTTSSIDFGLLGTPGFAAGGFLVSPYARSKSEPDIQLTVFPVVSEPHMYKKYGDISNKTANDTPQPSQIDLDERKEEDHEILVTIALLNPDARFQVTLNHTSPLSTPLLSLPKGKKSYLSLRDKQVLSWGIQQVRMIFQTPPLRDLTLGEITPGSSIVGDKLLKWIDSSSLTNSHWIGTASMGPSHPSLLPILNRDGRDRIDDDDDDNTFIEDDDNSQKNNDDDDTSNYLTENTDNGESSISPSQSPSNLNSDSIIKKRHLKQKKKKSNSGSSSQKDSNNNNNNNNNSEDNNIESVIDSQFRVRGVKNLRVADASAIPIIPNGNVHSTVAMIASRAADMLIEEYKKESELQSNVW